MKVKKALISVMLLNNLLQASDLSLLVTERVSTFEAAKKDKNCRFLFPEQADYLVQKITDDKERQEELKKQLENPNIVCIVVRPSAQFCIKGYVFYYIPEGRPQSDGEALGLFVNPKDESVMQKLMSKVIGCGLKSLTIRFQTENASQEQFLLGHGFKDCSTRRERLFRWFK